MYPFHRSRRIAASALVAVFLWLPASAFAHGGGGGHGGGGCHHGGGHHGGGRTSSPGVNWGGRGGYSSLGVSPYARNYIPPEEPFFPDDLPSARLHRFLVDHMPHLFGDHHLFGAP